MPALSIPIKRFHQRYFLVTIFILLLSACSQQTTIPKPPQQTTQTIPDEWIISAKLGVRQKEDSGSVKLHWRQQQDNYHIRITAPFGQGSGTISGNKAFIQIERSQKKRQQPSTIVSNNPEQLIADTFGWQLPLQELSYWVRGLSSPQTLPTYSNYAPNGTLKELEQSGWQIRYSRYQQVDNWLMPNLVRLEKADVVLKLSIKEWQFIQ